MTLPLVVFSLALLRTACGAEADSTSFEVDPYLQYRPEFARSLPIQILLTGIVLTFVSVLFVHLVFTAQYHWPLAPLNFVLQLFGALSLLITLFASLHIVLSASVKESQEWPYMLSYIAVKIPSSDGSVISRVTWAVLHAWTACITQITHIQFLTMLYPSYLEARLILGLLAPLSVVASVMQLLAISPNGQVGLVASAIRNVCNATLSLLFTTALFIWGLLVNRRQAWRLEGGTAVFGGAALLLALVSTALNFLYVPREEEYLWLPGLMCAVVLWQNFLGLWWWVGAGNWNGLSSDAPVEEVISKLAKLDRKKRERCERRKVTREKARMALKGVAGALMKNRRPSRLDGEGEARPPSPASLSSPPRPDTPLRSSSPSPPASINVGGQRTGLFPNFMRQWYWKLRYAHQAAAQEQTAEQQERIREIESFSWWGPLGRWRLQNATTYV